MEDDGMNIQATDCQVKILKNKKYEISKKCECGGDAFGVEISDPKSLISANLELLVRDKEFAGSRTGGTFDIGWGKSWKFDCSRCKRELVFSVRFSLTDKEWARIYKERWQEGETTPPVLYKGLIEIKTKVKGGYISNTRGEDNIGLAVRCGNCFQKIELTEALTYFNSLCADGAAMILQSDTPIKTKTFTQTMKCPNCDVEKLGISVTITPKMPESAKDRVAMYREWKV